MKLFSSSIVYICSNLFSASIPFLLLPILTRYLGAEEYGRLAVFQVFCSIFVVFCGTFLVSSLKRKFFDADDPEMLYSSYVANGILLVSTCFGIVFIFLLFAADLISSVFSVPPYMLYCAAIYGYLNVIIQIRLNQWQIRKEAPSYGVFQCCNALLNGLLSIALVFLVFESAAGRVLGQVGSVMILVFAAAFTIRNFRLSSIVISITAMTEMLRYGAPLIPHLLAGGILMSVDRAIIASELTLAQAGIYMAAFQLARSLNIIFDGVNKAISAPLFEILSSDQEAQKYKVARWSYIYCCICLVLSIAVGFFLDYFVVFLLGDEFSGTREIIVILCVGFAFKAWYLTFSNFLLYDGKTFTISCVSIAVGILAVSLIFILIKSHGLVGVAFAFAISMFARAFGVYVFSWKNAKPSLLFGRG